jgi:polyisoprenoid-binding protein YceI
MKKLVLSIVAVSALFIASCGNNEKKVEASEAQEVNQAESENVVSYSNVAEGSYLDWRASHLAGVQPRWGKAMLQSADIKVENGAVVNAKVVIDMGAFTVDNFEDDPEKTQKLLDHLQSSDFFKINEYPVSTFELTSLEEGEGEYNAVVTGNLTILDQSKSITFQANVEVNENQVTINSEDFIIDRRDWGLTYNTEGTAGVPTDYLIDDEVGFTIHVTVTK